MSGAGEVLEGKEGACGYGSFELLVPVLFCRVVVSCVVILFDSYVSVCNRIGDFGL